MIINDMRRFFLFLPFLLATSYAAVIPQTFRRATVCNGHAELCSRSYGNVTFLGAHDSFAFSNDPLALARDQAVDIPSQLDLGVRLLQAQSHEKDGELHFCHTSCDLFDGGTVEDYLKTVKTFLDANPNEVLTLLFTNPEGKSVVDDWKPAFDNSGISELAFVPPSVPVKQSDWPTLGEMIDSGKRVVVFLDAGADTSQVNFILPEFEMIWETPFSVTDDSFPCSVDRIDGPLATEDHSYMINHSLNKNILPIGDGVIVSDPLDASTTNGIPSIMDNVNGCAPLGANRNPQFVLLDFVDIGDGLKAINLLNGLPADTGIVPTPTPTICNSTAGAGVAQTSTQSNGAVAVRVRRPPYNELQLLFSSSGNVSGKDRFSGTMARGGIGPSDPILMAITFMALTTLTTMVA